MFGANLNGRHRVRSQTLQPSTPGFGRAGRARNCAPNDAHLRAKWRAAVVPPKYYVFTSIFPPKNRFERFKDFYLNLGGTLLFDHFGSYTIKRIDEQTKLPFRHRVRRQTLVADTVFGAKP